MKRVVILILLMGILISSGCVNKGPNENDLVDNSQNQEMSIAIIPSEVEKIEVLHFHGNQQCQGCINVGKCAEDAVNEYFQDEQKSGLVVFAHVNGQLPENSGLVQKYGATGSSLWIGVYNQDGTFSKEQNINVWYKTGDMEKCREYIKEVIEGKMEG